AHRGNVPGYPENTLATFGQAVKLGAEVLEMDLRGTQDGHVVIMHDPMVDRTTNGKGNVVDFPLEELKKLDAGHGEKIPMFEEVLNLISGTGVKLLLDIKETPGLDKKKVVRLIEKYNAVLNVIVGPRSLTDLETFKKLNPNLRTLGFIPSIVDIEAFVAAGVDIIRLRPKWINVDPKLVVKCHGLNKPVWSTVDDMPRPQIEELIGFGVDGILSDLPDIMNLIIQDLKKSRGF
ncbi:MAG TPA: glycerophosphodiester phosphodiesterase family protein, partial [Bacillota bacterium]|nr:glycerophosphodiester phosphodiesterase family protein [Bacillota bacterium]